MRFDLWDVLFPLLFVAGAYGLGKAIASLLHLTDGAVIARAPAVSGERLRVPAAGDYDLCVEGRTFSTDFVGVRYALHDASGAAIRISPKLGRTKVSGMTTTRISVGMIRLTQGGELSLSVEGMSAKARGRSWVVIQRPIGLGIGLRVAALVITAAMTLAGLIGSILAWAQIPMITSS